MVSNKIIYDKLIFYYDVDDMNITIYGKDWKPVEYLSDSERREKVRQHILRNDLTKRIGGKKYMTLLNENKVGGTYQYKWTPNRELASGMYLFELKMKNKTRHQKITYIK